MYFLIYPYINNGINIINLYMLKQGTLKMGILEN